MPLPKRWRSLDRAAVARAPERWGVYELGVDGEVVEVGHGVLHDELKDALHYGEADQVRWEEAPTRERARELAGEHRSRIDG